METNTFPKNSGRINIVLQHEQQPIREEHNHMEIIDNLFEDFIGLQDIKAIVKEIYAMSIMNEKRKMYHLSMNEQSMHMIFHGNPGTGKTTIARKLADLFCQLNILTKGHFIEAQRADIVGEYIGQTAIKTKQLVERAQGGVLFIDEAYALARGGNKDFGKEAIDTLVKLLEDYRHDFVVILAGYSNEMNFFLKQNPGLSSRFPFQLTFPNYTVDELLKIMQYMAKKQDYHLSARALLKIENHLNMIVKEDRQHFSNARYVRNLLERAIRHHSIRMLTYNHCSIHQLTMIREDDFVLQT